MFKTVIKWIKVTLVFLVLQTSALPVSAQNNKADSLKSLLSGSKSDTLKVNLLNDLAYHYYTTDYTRTLAYSTEALNLAEKLRYVRGKARALQINGLVYSLQNKHALAIESEQQAISLASSINDYNLLAKAYNTAGIAYNRLNDLNNADDAFNNALNAMEKTADKSYTAAILHNIGSLYIAQKKYSSAIDNFTKAAEQNSRSGNKQWLVQNYFGLGRTYNLLKQYDLALKYLAEATHIAHQMKFYQPEIKSLGLSGAIYSKQKNYSQALHALSQAEKIAVDNNITGERLSLYNDFANLYELQKDYFKQSRYLKLYQALYDSTYNTEKSKLIAEYQSKFQNQQNKLDNERLKKEQAINKGKLTERNYFLIGLSATLVIVLGFFAGIYKAYVRIKERNRVTQAQKDEIEAQRKELENLNQIKDKLFSVIAHDLRGPFATLQGVFQLMEEGAVNKEDVNGILNDMGKQITNSRLLLDNLLIWAKSQLNGFYVRPQRVDIYEMVIETTEAFRSDINKKGLDLINDIVPATYADADTDMVKAVIRNLITNAIKFTPQGGKITLAASYTNHMLMVSVQDTGEGLSAQQEELLFKGDFYSSKSANNPDGAGLGLQICKEFVEKNGGQIWFKTEKGRGSIFYFTLPLAR
jgi:two-component system sensor histidine kinase/response regulator